MNQLAKRLRFVGKTIIKVPSETNMGKYKKNRRRNTSHSQKITKEDKLHLIIIGIVEGTHFLRHIVHGSIDIADCTLQAAFLI